MKRSWGFGLAVFAGLFLGALVLADLPAPGKALDIRFGEWKPVKVLGITQEGRVSFDGQRSEVRARLVADGEPRGSLFVCWREARSGILCFGEASHFYVCLEDRVIGLPKVFMGSTTCIEVYERKVALEDFTKTRDELQAMEVFSGSSFLDYKECLTLREAVGLDFFDPSHAGEIKNVSIEEVTLAGEEMTLHLTNHVKTKAQVTFSARTLKPVKAQVEEAK